MTICSPLCPFVACGPACPYPGGDPQGQLPWTCQACGNPSRTDDPLCDHCGRSA